MHKSVRATVAATVLAIAATAGVASAMTPQPGASIDDHPAGELAAVPTRTEAPPSLPAVSTAELDPAVLAAARSGSTDGPQSVVEVIKLEVIGGDLELVTDHATVTLERVGSSRSWAGTLPPVRVIDARGTHEGWSVRWAVEDVSVAGAANRVRVEPAAPVVVAGLDEGLLTGSAGPSGGAHGRRLFGAQPGYGGGTYEAGGKVTLKLPPHVDVDHLVVELAFSLS